MTEGSGRGARERVLVIFPGALGDLICFVPTLREIARRHREASRETSIELTARAELARFAVSGIGVDAGHSIDRREVSRLFGENRDSDGDARRFFGGFSRIYSFFGAGHVGFRRALIAASDAEVSFYRFRPDGRGHITGAYLQSIGETAEAVATRIDLLAEDFQAASRRLEAFGLKAGGFALLLPGSGSAAKNWPAENFAELAGRLAARIPVAIVLGPAEQPLESFFGRRYPVLTGLELGELAAIAASAACFVGNDSGISHLAAASGAPGIALFGPTDPRRWRPMGAVEVLRRQPLAALEASEVAAALEAIAGRSN